MINAKETLRNENERSLQGILASNKVKRNIKQWQTACIVEMEHNHITILPADQNQWNCKQLEQQQNLPGFHKLSEGTSSGTMH